MAAQGIQTRYTHLKAAETEKAAKKEAQKSQPHQNHNQSINQLMSKDHHL